MLFTKKNRLYIRYDHEISNEKLGGGNHLLLVAAIGTWGHGPLVPTSLRPRYTPF